MSPAHGVEPVTVPSSADVDNFSFDSYHADFTLGRDADGRSTLHTTDASKTVDRIIGIFPKSEEHVIRTRLAQSFKYIISQRLVPTADGKGRLY